MILLVDDDVALHDVREALRERVHRLGPARVSPGALRLLEALGAIPRHSPPSAANALAGQADDPHTELVSYQEAADLLGLSKTTIGRRVRAGALRKVGRRVVRADVIALARGVTDG